MATTRKRVLALALIASFVLGQYLFIRDLIAQGELPNPIAIHWGFSGEPDGFSDPTSFLRGITIVYLVLLVMMAFVGFAVKRRLLRPLLFGFFGFFIVLLATIFSVSILVQVGRSPEEVSVSLWVWVLLLLFPVALVAAILTSPRVLLRTDLRIQMLGLTLLKLEFADLTGVREVQLLARDFGGLGIRYSSRTLAFIPRAGKGVLISTNFGESVAVRSDTPELLVSAISARIEKS